LISTSAANASNASVYRLPIAIPAGTRIAIRSSGNKAADATNAAATRLYDSGFGAEGCAGADAIGFTATTTTGTTITAGSAAGVYGAYTQIIAATARDYVGFVIDFLNGSDIDWHLATIAIGPWGSEIPIIPNIGFYCSPLNYSNTVLGPFYIPIPAGTRIAARLDDWYGGNEQVDIILHGLYK
jgi:hypothetical protein